VEQTNKADKITMQYLFTAPDYSEGAVGKSLAVMVQKYAPGSPMNIMVPTCPKDQQSGTLIVNGKPYTRCDNGSGLRVYRVSFETNSSGYHWFLDFSYNSSDPNSQDTKIIETIIQSFKF
jgi:hypothetical protein